MTLSTADDLDRATSGRFVRNLALSLSGGALVTLLGATAAQAQDGGAASTDSAGTGAAHSGDATAVGNQSGTTQTQTVTVSGNLGVIQVINQQAAVSNVGAAVANTGGNIAIGNQSNNNANATQTGASGLGPASNNGSAANGSNGTATISTGNASAVGNQSNTRIEQTAVGSAHGQLGGILVINQDAVVTNSGVALANSGGNVATGNNSNNNAGLLQDANSAAGIAANDGRATNRSDGLATINTGNASATGNKSDTQVIQSATGSAGGALGGLVIIDQDAFVVNTGAAAANTGGNVATGNSSQNNPNKGNDVDQSIGTAGTPPLGPVGVASNNGEASNWSDGEANIRTGDAGAWGNDSTTTVEQTAHADITGPGGGSLVSQSSGVVNAGVAVANSGGNFANGNNSTNNAGVLQTAPSSGGTDVGVVGNFGLAENQSDGTGVVSSGGAYAAGNRSQTNVEQNVEANGGAFNLQTQANLVTNTGASFANSGMNAGVGNNSTNNGNVSQTATLSDDPGIDVGVVGQFGKASNVSDGTAAIETGTATAVGNDSETGIGQTIDPDGLVVNTQAAAVVNAGIGVANSGGNGAVGNLSTNTANANQDASIGDGNATPPTILAGTLVASNNGEASSASDGLATIKTGDAAATGNESSTNVRQEADGSIDGNGVVINTQVAAVANLGLGVANSGLNGAAGNISNNNANLDQEANVLSDNGGGAPNLLAGIVTASNDGTASNASDGEANITTGKASGAGNQSRTVVDQRASGEIDGLGAVFNTQVAPVVNAGVGVGNSGLNGAVGNLSDSNSDLDQEADVASGNNGTTSLVAGFVTAANSGTAENASDGTADIRTGHAQGTGNASATHLTQDAHGHAPGLVVNTQVGGVLNTGVGIANSGVNAAVGNLSDQDQNGGAQLEQNAEVLSENNGTANGTVLGAVTAANSGTASNTSDGTATIRTGGAQGQGNVSSTFLGQGTDSQVDGLGAVISTQVGGVVNAGVGIANSGVNGALGNGSSNNAELEQGADVASDNTVGTTLNVVGPATASNSGEASNTSDGSGHITTGGALATGNASATNLSQHQDGEVESLGIVLGTQVGGVANVGAGIANSGVNGAAGNISDNDIDGLGGGGSPANQDAGIGSDSGAPFTGTIIGPATAANSGTASNTSDGEACICTGSAVASGNVSSTTLIQDQNLSVGSGAIILTEAGGVLNAGLGLANTGINGAVGNSSENDVLFNQDSTINDALTTPIVGPQTAHNGGTAANSSNGRGHVASGNASGTGNQSTTDFVQAASVDADFAVSTLTGGTTNAGLGLANTGLNLGIGNDSTNTAVLDQAADGAGVVSNDGEATNDSDGTAQIGDPTCCGAGEETPETPGETPETGHGLPRTGAELEAEAAIGLMLLLLGFGLRRRSRTLA